MNQPSTRINILLIVVVLIVVITISFNSIKKSSPKPIPVPNQETVMNLEIKRNGIEKEEIDSDGDGLLDWEEELRGTNPNIPDTDNDGTNDGDEVAKDRDPLNSTKNDSILDDANLSTTLTNFKPDSTTDKVSKNLINNYLNFKQNDSYTPEIGAEIVAGITAGLQTINTTAPKYTSRSLITFPNNDDVKNRVYANTFAGHQKNFTIELAAISESNSSRYLSSVSQTYKNFSVTLAGLEVPYSLSEIHAQIINNFNEIGGSLDTINSYDNDPAVAIFAVQKFQAIEEQQPLLYNIITQYFVESGIIFESNEPAFEIWK